MRGTAFVLGVICAMLVGCAQPALVSCPDSSTVCPDGCVDLEADPLNCGACGVRCGITETCGGGHCLNAAGACAINNGGCSPQALCMDTGTSVECLCGPGFTGDGFSCAACTACAPTQFASAPCSPLADTVCTLCSPACVEGMFESSACGPITDRACSPCTFCGQGFYTVASCSPTSNSVCAACGPGCLSCNGPGPTCQLCDNGFVLSNGACVAAVCGNGVIEPGEQCDDNNMAVGDGCNANCMVEGGAYCFGEVMSTCRPGTCVTESATSLPLGSAFSLDGAGTASAAGLHLTARSMVRTTAPVAYPMLVEATVVYSGSDITYAGSRGDGLRDGTASNEPTDPLRARLSAAAVELATGPGTTQIATAASFTPTQGVPYHVRYIDDGLFASVEWFNETNLAEGAAVQQMTSYHGSADRAFVGGGDQGAVTISNIRVCSAPTLPVTSGLVAHYSAIPSWMVVKDMAGVVSSWLDESGNSHTLSAGATSPNFVPSINNKPTVDFNGGGGLATTNFTLTTDVSVFVVIHHRASSATFGAIAHHGDRDNDWSMEQNGSGNPNVLHWQTNNDNVNMNLTLADNTNYVMTGIFNGTSRYFSATTFDASTITPVSINDASHTITTGSKAMFVGTSNNNEASNAAIGELVYYDHALTTAERDAVISYLQALWR